MQQVVLIGAGHAHVALLRMHAMRPLPAQVTLVIDDPASLYSGMVPGLVEGRYRPDELTIDARPLARRAGVRVVHAAATAIDPDGRRVALRGRAPIRYDVASINIGSTVAGLDTPGVRDHAVPTRPIRALVDALDARIEALGPRPRAVVVGAGAGGVELAFCLERRLRRSGRAPEVQLVYASSRPLPALTANVSARVERAAHARGIGLRPDARVTAVDHDHVRLDDGTALASDLTLWVTGAAALPFGPASGLPCDGRGFVRVDDTLTVLGHPGLFAVGDCAVPESWPAIPKAGVYAVRQGPVLWRNLHAQLTGGRLRTYHAQRDFFGILNLGDDTAIGAKWGLAVQGGWVMRHKDRIDRAFVDRFRVLGADGRPTPAYARPMPGADAMRCGGCAAKVDAGALHRALTRAGDAPLPDGALGLAAREDVVAWPDAGRLVVQNVDAFPAFDDDPWLVGRVAALNAASDLWAKGVDAAFAVSVVQLPERADHEELLAQVLAGVRAALDPYGVRLLGGHTTIGDTLSVGLTVTGFADALRWPMAAARPGDALILTGRLGSGVLLHADAAGRARGADVWEALQAMQRGNHRASATARAHVVHAATDVTGFGLANHLLGMCRASGCAATVRLGALPAYPGVEGLLSAGERSTFHLQNRGAAGPITVEDAARLHPRYELLFDPQTAGGLLLATPAPAPLLDALRDADVPARVIGGLQEGAPGVGVLA